MKTAASSRRTPAEPAVRYSLSADAGRFLVEGYPWAKPFSNFLPGIAGKWGVPLWAYYVSQGQAICSVGVRDKNGQILEFQSFNLALSRVAREGFRTFLRLDGGEVYEPFQKRADPKVVQTMEVAPAELSLRERNLRLGLEIEVVYFGLPNLRVAGLARLVFVRDLTGRARQLEWIDGAARVLPLGLDHQRIKGVARHVEAMMGVASRGGVPLFRLKQSAEDSERVGGLEGGNFYAVPGSPLGAGLVTDPDVVFGEGTLLDHPWPFARGGARAVLDAEEHRDTKTPCAFAVRAARLPAHGEVRLQAVLGSVSRDEDLDPLSARLREPSFLLQKREENLLLVAEIGDRCFCATSSPAFDAYAQQTFLDNVVRGGMPMTLRTKDGPSAFYLYSRQNGDLERDYHFFVLEPTWLSQGTGHYRSVLQNRRTDTWFFPEVEDANLVTFLSLVQLDGYNPLEVNGSSYRAEDERALARFLGRYVRSAAQRPRLAQWMREGFTPGELLMRLDRLGKLDEARRDAALAEALAFSRENEVGGLHEGFWADHWHYNFDLLEVYASVYPDRLGQALFGRRAYRTFDDPDVVLPRDERTVDAGGGRIRSWGAVVRDPAKLAHLSARKADRYSVRAGQNGAVYRTTLFAKLLTIVANRLATLDPAGRGVEMEAGKPGWNDSLNGLPGLFGSGLSEALELRRAVRALLAALPLAPAEVPLFEELADLVSGLRRAIATRLSRRGGEAAFAYWDESNRLKEAYRERTRLGVTGREVAVGREALQGFLEAGLALLELGVGGAGRHGALSPQGVPYTYFVNEVARARPLNKKSHLGLKLVRPLAFRQRPVKLFLEGPVHWLKDRPEDAAAVYAAVRRSPLFDRKLGMYKACEPMDGETPELGRAVGAYPRGWIENESIYLHMEYKWLLEVLRSGLAAEFWRDARTALVPFLDPAVYGRSPLEGASFVVSSAFADPARHGQAFQPRLSGITCEFLHMWIVAMAGERPFALDEKGALRLSLAPRLPGWLFTEAPASRFWRDPVDGWQELSVPANSLAFKLLGRALVVYSNPGRKDTFGPRGAGPVAYRLTYRDGRDVRVLGPSVPAPHAAAVRDGAVRRLDVTLAQP